ncbi:MAG: glycosyltransferase family 2 protein [Deltaproteobacteria bacterium]|nr:MAG: glycosyltransferase family 2 protein [Deltaproteobacteria bacterium]
MHGVPPMRTQSSQPARSRTWERSRRALKAAACGFLALGGQLGVGATALPRPTRHSRHLFDQAPPWGPTDALAVQGHLPAAVATDSAPPAPHIAFPEPFAVWAHCLQNPKPLECFEKKRSTTPAVRKVAICAIARDEAYDLPEWMAHHRNLGVGTFYLFDHGSTPPMAETLGDSLMADDVVYNYYNHTAHDTYPQTAVYNACIANYASRQDFMAFIDVDEFLVMPQGDSLPAMLGDFVDHGALAVNWRQFGSSGHRRRPAGRVVDNYVFCYPATHENCRIVKLIANTKYLRRFDGPHTASFTDGKLAVTENMEPVDGPQSDSVSMNKVALYHYVTKSLEDFRHKMARGAAHGTVVKEMNFFRVVNREATALCMAARRAPVDDHHPS